MKRLHKFIAFIDCRLIYAIDWCTTYIQRRGWMPLNTIKMVADCMFWGFLINASIHTFMVYVVAPFGVIGLLASHTRWKKEVGYWENYRKMQDLNAKVVAARDFNEIWRGMVFLVFTPMIIADIISIDLKDVPSSLLVIITNYLTCCFYLGPGDFAKYKNESLSGLPQEG